MGGLPEPRGGLTDKAVAGGVLLLVALGSLHSVIAPGKEPLAVTALTWALITAVGCGALYFSPRFPVGAAVVSLAATFAYYVLSVYDGPLMIAPIVALYMIASRGRPGRRRRRGPARHRDGRRHAVGQRERQRGRPVHDDRMGRGDGGAGLGPAQQAGYLAEAEQRATGEERLRIARELHDVAGPPHLLIDVQAETALHRFDRDPEQAAGRPRGGQRRAARRSRAAARRSGCCGTARTRRPRPQPGLTRSATWWSGAGRGTHGRAHRHHRRGPPPPTGVEPRRVPDRPGGAHQRGPARRRRRRQPCDVRPGPPARSSSRWPTTAAARPGTAGYGRPGMRSGRGAGRRADRGPGARRRLPRPGPPAPASGAA